MRTPARRLLCFVLAAIGASAGMLLSDSAWLMRPGPLLSEAQAIIGHPLTPLSYAGVARRTTRRAVAAGAAMGAAAATVPVVVAPACVTRYDAYGRPYYVCP